jgi:2'-5' RNA ligase
MVNAWEAVPIVLAGLGIFPSTPPVVWAAPVVTERLLTLHIKLHSALGPLGVHPHHRPGAWMPHVTLSQHGRSSTALLVEAAALAWPGPISGEANRIDFLRLHPVNVLRSVALQPAG